MSGNSPSTKQGITFEQYLKNINKNKKKRIQKSTKPNIESPSWFEGFENLADVPENEYIFILRDKYNETMHQYAATFAQYVDNINQNTSSTWCGPTPPPAGAPNITPSCSDKTDNCNEFDNCEEVTTTTDVNEPGDGWVVGQDGNIYWLNKFQYLRKLGVEPSENHTSCGGGSSTWNPEARATVNTGYVSWRAMEEIDENSRLHGNDIGIGEPCDIEGKMIKNKDSANKKYAWVDQKGKAHLYTKETWEKRAPSCKGITDYHVMDSDAMFDHVTSSALPKSRYSKCVRGVATSLSSTKDELIELTDELISIAGQIETEINNRNAANDASNEDSTAQLKSSITELEREKDQLSISLETLESEYGDQKQHVRSAYYYYIAWTLGAAAVLGITIYKINKK